MEKLSNRTIEKNDSKPSYFNDIIQKTKEMNPESIVFAGPGFTKEEFQKYLKEKNQKLANQVYFETTNQTGVTGLSELVKSGTLEKLVHEAQILQDTQTVESLGAKVHLLHAKTDPGKKILGFGGIVALLRYKRR